MGRPENFESLPETPRNAEEALRQAALDLTGAVGTSAAGGWDGAVGAIANTARALPALELVDIGAEISKMGDRSWRVREAATRRLESIGAQALPQLLEAQKNPDLEIARRAERIVGKLISGDLPDVRGTSRFLAYDAAFYEMPDEQIRKEFNSLITRVDAYSSDPKRVERRLHELNEVKRHVTLDEQGREGVERQIEELRNIKRLSADTRVDMARYLTRVGDSAQAVRLLQDAMDRCPAVTADRSFMKAVCAAGADQDPAFKKRFVSRGGDWETLLAVKNEKGFGEQLLDTAKEGIQKAVDGIRDGAEQLNKRIRKLFD